MDNLRLPAHLQTQPAQPVESRPTQVSGNFRTSPLVVGILVVADRRRLPIARVAVNKFFEQTYQNKRFLIINACGEPITNRVHELVEERQVNPLDFPTVAAMRNYALERCVGAWVVPWDDDDISHPHRIMIQMAHRVEQACCVLAYQLRADVCTSTQQNMLCLSHKPEGHASTIIFPNRLGVEYEEHLSTGEDIAMLDRQWGDNRVVINNEPGWFPGPVLSLACWHGLNLTSREEFLGQFSRPEYIGALPPHLTESHLDYVKYVLDKHGLKVAVVPKNQAVGSH